MNQNDVKKILEILNGFSKDRKDWLKYQWRNVLSDAECVGNYVGRDIKKIIDMWAKE